MVFSHVFSDAVLAGTGVGVFWHYYQRMALYNRMLWGFFLLSIAFSALVGVIKFAGNESIGPLHNWLLTLVGSLGFVSVVVGVWTLLHNLKVGLVSFGITVLIGLALFALLLLPQVQVFAPVVQSAAILVVMLVAVSALARRDPRAVWVVVAVMLLGLATKALWFDGLIHPVDFYHYAVALALLCFGKAVERKRQ